MKKILMAFLGMACLFAYAQKKIDSAFGWTLGQSVDSSIKLETIDNQLGFYFEPTKKLQGFDLYWATVTPLTKKVVSIVCVSHYDDAALALKEQEKLRKMYEKTYDAPFKLFKDDKDEKIYGLLQGNRGIFIRLYRDSFLINISLVDVDMFNLKKKEDGSL